MSEPTFRTGGGDVLPLPQVVEIDLATARLIRRAFVPRNPRKMRNCDEEVRQAAIRFIEAVELCEKYEPSANSHSED